MEKIDSEGEGGREGGRKREKREREQQMYIVRVKC